MWLQNNQGWLARARERWIPVSPEPLRLRCWMRGPVVWDHYDGLTIEGALQHAVVLLETGEMACDVFADAPRDVVVDIQIPIAEVERAGVSIHCASWAVPPMCAQESSRYRRQRTRAELFPVPGGRGVLNTSGGIYKDRQIATPTLATPYLDFFVVGDRGRLAELCITVGALGRSRSAGLGAVLGIEIETVDDDRSVEWNSSPMRAVPIDITEAPRFPPSVDIRPATTRAPYWQQRTRTLCAVPYWRDMQEMAA